MPRRLHEAEENCKKAIKMEPTNPEHYINLAMIYKKAGLEAKAKAMFEEALKWDTENETALTELGRRKGGFFKALFSSDKK
jgi:Tfp pilus assembly protein PilF